MMRFVLLPLHLCSLERMAVVKMAVTLWNQNDVRALVAEFNVAQFVPNDEPITSWPEWKDIEERVTEKVPHYHHS